MGWLMSKFIDLVGKRFDRLIVIRRVPNRGHSSCWLCKCDCGKEIEVIGSNLRGGTSTSCGCYRLESLKNRAIDLIGKRFGRLVVISRVPSSNNARWKVRCDCGKEKEVYSNNLKHIKSCGCYSVEFPSGRIEYGLAAKRIAYKRYKDNARIRKLDFKLSFEQFLNLTQQNCHYCGSGPSNFSKGNGNGDFKYNGIDRIDNSKGYFIENCVTCCEDCNKAKRDKPYNEFLEWIQKLVQHSDILFKGVVNAS